MPLYEITHVCPLTTAQQSELADAITSIHSSKFTTPRMFVNVRYTSDAANPTYVGGKLAAYNRIVGYVRVGPSRKREEFNALTMEIVAAWDRIVPMPKVRRGDDVDYSLWSCVIVGGLVAGWEGGVQVPPAGEDIPWLKENWDEFQRRAKEGDVHMQDLVEDVKGRGLLSEINGKSAIQKLEESLGWGDSA